MSATKMISARLPDYLIGKLEEAAKSPGQTKSAIIEAALSAHFDPGNFAHRALRQDASRERDTTIAQLGRVAAELKMHGGLLALAVKRDGGLDRDEMDRCRLKIAAVAEEAALVIERLADSAE
jgi:predicted transcriptional regulator